MEKDEMLAIMETVGKDLKVFYQDREAFITYDKFISICELNLLIPLVEKSKMKEDS